MITGAELLNIINQEIDEAYTGYYAPAQWNRILKRNYTQTIQNIYLERLTNRNAFDQLSYLISLDTVIPVLSDNLVYHTPIPITSVQYNGINLVTYTTEFPHQLIVGSIATVNDVTGTLTVTRVNQTGVVVSTPTVTSFTMVVIAPNLTGVADANTGTLTYTGMISDYMHWLYGKGRFTSQLLIGNTQVTITDATNSSPIRITLNKRTKLRDYDSVLISGVTGNTNTNGTRYVLQLNEFDYALYTDSKLLTATVGNGTFGGTTLISRTVYNTLEEKRSDQKGSVYGTPTIDSPRFQQGELSFQFYPKDSNCDEITVDYIRKQPQEIDVADNIINLENFYPSYFLEKIASEAGRSFAMSSRDGSLLNVETEQVISNP